MRFQWFLYSFLIVVQLKAQDSTVNYKSRRLIGFGMAGVAYSGSIIGLQQLWYKPYQNGKFHFFDDAGEWLQMDKVGHTFSSYQLGKLGINSMKWMGYSPKKSIFIGGLLGTAYLSTIEIFDGFSSGWGFSWSDMAANVAGSALIMSQHLIWKEERIQLKFSFHQTSFPAYRPGLLGENFPSQLVKDYNGQTYWLSISPFSYAKNKLKKIEWLALAFGYSADGMISGSDNYVLLTGDGKLIGNNRYRKYILSLDINLSGLPCKRKWLRTVFSAMNCIKIPFPAIEINHSGTKFHPVYF